MPITSWLQGKAENYEVTKVLNKISWRTTTWGIIGIAATVLGALWQFHTTGHLDVQSTLKQVSGIATACGLLAAADHKNLPPGA